METNTSNDPSINTDNVCHLARLPTEILNNIAYFLLPHETPDELQSRCEILLQERYRQSDRLLTYTPFGCIYSTGQHVFLYDQEYGRKTLFSAAGNTFLQKLRSGFSRFMGVTKNFSLLNHNLSPSRHYVAITEIVHNYDSYPNESLSETPANCQNVHLIRLANQTKETINTENLPHNCYILPIDTSPAILTLLASKGYAITKYSDYILKNSLNKLAISFDHNKIAIANDVQIFLAQRDAQGKWSAFQLIKTLKFAIKNINNITYPITYPSKNIYDINFNKQGTALWVNFHDDNRESRKYDYSEIVPIHENLLDLYFRQNLICKKIKH